MYVCRATLVVTWPGDLSPRVDVASLLLPGGVPEASPAAYLPNLAASLNNLASFLGGSGQTDQAEELLAEMLTVFADGTNGIGYLLLIRGLRRAAQKPSG